MKKKGFTLIELLAVIVLLAVIALIAVPLITNVIDKAKQGALKDSAYGIIEASELYLAKNIKEGIPDTIEFTCSNNKCISGEETIDYKGNIDSGKVRIYSDSKIELCITNNTSSALKIVSSKEVVVSTGTCNYDELNYGVSALVSKDDYDKINKKYNDLKALVDQADATAEDVKEGKKVLVDGKIVTGTKVDSGLMLLGTYSAEYAQNYILDVKDIISNYSSLTNSNFLLKNDFLWNTDNGSIPSYGYVAFHIINPTFDYNPSTGLLTINVGGGFMDSPNNKYDQKVGNTGDIYYVK